jgi:hypothetical protein
MDEPLKRIARDAVPRALEKAERYRLLNEPGEAESICRDVLAVEPDHPSALVTLLLSLTDQFASGARDRVAEAGAIAARLRDPYERAYYAGIVCERRGKATIEGADPGAVPNAYGWIREAMKRFEEAEAIRPPGNEDAILRWNACARLLERHRDRWAGLEEAPEPQIE